MRLGMLVTGAILVVAFLAIVPARRTWFTPLGAGTLYAYLLHGFAVKALAYTGWIDAAALHTIPGAVSVMAGCAALATVLCTRPVRRATQWAIQPTLAWAFNNSARIAHHHPDSDHRLRQAIPQ